MFIWLVIYVSMYIVLDFYLGLICFCCGFAVFLMGAYKPSTEQTNGKKTNIKNLKI